MKHEQRCETWPPARQAGQGSGRVEDGLTNFKSCVPAGQAGKGPKSGRAVPIIEFMEQKTPHEKIQISAKLLFVARPRLCLQSGGWSLRTVCSEAGASEQDPAEFSRIQLQDSVLFCVVRDFLFVFQHASVVGPDRLLATQHAEQFAAVFGIQHR